jgi:arylsulfatase A-like enzyme
MMRRLTVGLWTTHALASTLLIAGMSGTPAEAMPSEADMEAAPGDRPNILFIIIDDIGVDQMRSFGYGLDNQAVTPTIDTIAEGGLRFRNAWSMPECSPSRVSFFTGRYPLRTGVLNITLDNTLANSQMSAFEVTTPQILRDQGYKSGFFGKWHHTAFASNTPPPDSKPNPGNPLGNAAPRDMGWDYFEGMLEGAPRGIDTTAGGVADPNTYSCGFVDDATSGACYLTDGSCAEFSSPGGLATAIPGRTCLERGGILVPEQACQSPVPHNVLEGFKNFNGYYVAPLLINHEDGEVELVAGFDDVGGIKDPTDPRARRYLTKQQTDAAIAWINKQKESPNTPWMATLSYSTAHLPAQQPPQSPLRPGSGQLDCTSSDILAQRSLINQMLEAMDEEISRLLVETGLATHDGDKLVYKPDATNTMVVVVGDNGSYLDTVRLPFDPTRAKGTVYQTGVWVPLIVSGPLVNPANVGKEVPHMVNAAVDVFSLFGEVAGIDVRRAVPRSHTLDAKPMMPYLTNPGQKGLRKTNFTQTGTVLQAPGVVPPCVINVAGEDICTQIFTFEELCKTEGGTWYGNYTSCCALQEDRPDLGISILPYAASAVRDERFKLVRLEKENCESETNPFDIDYEFYEVNEDAPEPPEVKPRAETRPCERQPAQRADPAPERTHLH